MNKYWYTLICVFKLHPWILLPLVTRRMPYVKIIIQLKSKVAGHASSIWREYQKRYKNMVHFILEIELKWLIWLSEGYHYNTDTFWRPIFFTELLITKKHVIWDPHLKEKMAIKTEIQNQFLYHKLIFVSTTMVATWQEYYHIIILSPVHWYKPNITYSHEIEYFTALAYSSSRVTFFPGALILVQNMPYCVISKYLWIWCPQELNWILSNNFFF